MPDAWYVLRVETGKEETICNRIREWPGIDAFNPKRMEKVERRRRGGDYRRLVTETHRSLWPSYLFASWTLDDAYAWQSVVGEWGEGRLLGVFGILGGEFPHIIPNTVVENWIARANHRGVIEDLEAKLAAMRRGFGAGDAVRLSGGQWDGHNGTCQWADHRGTQVRLPLFNRDVAVYVPHIGSGVRVLGGETPANARTLSRRKRRKVLGHYRSLAAVAAS
jgi:transcription antitermination factor NusG